MYITATKKEMQSELQWWVEQKSQATQEKDLVYVRECEENINKLVKDIQNYG